MASIRRNRDILVVLSGDKFIAFSNGLEEVVITIPNAPKEEKEEKEPPKSTEAADVKNDATNCILASCFSASGKYFAVGDDQKQLHVYKVSPNWELISSRPVVRRCTAIVFPSNEKEVVVADKTGNVYKFSLIDTDSSGELILGHLSMVLDMAITKNDKYIITCERDEKVRISHYPNAYNIHSFCLLHTEYVSQVLYINKYDCVISGSGDGRLAVWKLDGKNLSCTDVIKGPRSQGQDELNVKGQGDIEVKGQGDMEVKGHDHMEVKGHDDTEVKGQTDDSCDALGVKKMVYHNDLNTIAVIFHRSPQLSLYQLDQQENGCQLLSCSTNNLSEEPWDICFDDKHRLWILLPSQQAPVVVYECSKNDSGSICLSETITEECMKEMKFTLCNKWPFFKASVESQKQFISLQKIRDYKNVQSYLEKKEERINAKKNKSSNNQPPTKKIKTS